MVVVHGFDQSRYDLLVSAPAFPPEPIAVPAWTHTRSLGEAIAQTPGVVQTFLRGDGIDRNRWGPANQRATSLLMQAVNEVSSTADFTLLLAETPPVEWLTAVPDPHAPVRDAANNLCGTIGVINRLSDGSVYATSALHAVGSATQVYVNGVAGTVQGRDPVTDSCLLWFEHDPFGTVRQPFHGASRVRPPRQHVAVQFEGADSKIVKSSVLRGFDDSILDPQPYLATKVYTDPDTNPGDSGAALIDPSTDEALGFAAYRTSAASPVLYSVWVWAEQVYDVFRL
jgi:S1-C subfamily serine protease